MCLEGVLNATVSRHFPGRSEERTYKCNHVELFGAFAVWKSEEERLRCGRTALACVPFCWYGATHRAVERTLFRITALHSHSVFFVCLATETTI